MNTMHFLSSLNKHVKLQILMFYSSVYTSLAGRCSYKISFQTSMNFVLEHADIGIFSNF